MENLKLAQKIKRLLDESRAKIPQLEEEILHLEKNLPKLKVKALRAEALGGDKKEKLEFEENERRLGELKRELLDSRQKIELLEDELRKLEMPALSELKKFYWPSYERAVKRLITKLKEAFEAEREVAKLEEEARRKIRELSPVPFSVLPPLRRLLVEDEGERPEYAPLMFFLKDVKAAGINVDDEKL